MLALDLCLPDCRRRSDALSGDEDLDGNLRRSMSAVRALLEDIRPAAPSRAEVLALIESVCGERLENREAERLADAVAELYRRP